MPFLVEIVNGSMGSEEEKVSGRVSWTRTIVPDTFSRSATGLAHGDCRAAFQAVSGSCVETAETVTTPLAGPASRVAVQGANTGLL